MAWNPTPLSKNLGRYRWVHSGYECLFRCIGRYKSLKRQTEAPRYEGLFRCIRSYKMSAYLVVHRTLRELKEADRVLRI
jgi:hypothetical protein